ncbi:MAG: peptidylprolyl isomerase [Alteromonadaceae bacterium]|nr:peptidylprolyl isomerase [Alteromonadaceae bacterium]
MKKRSLVLALTSVLALAACQQESTTQTKENKESTVAIQKSDLVTDAQKQAYALGENMGQYVAQQSAQQAELGYPLDKELVQQGFNAAMNGNALFTEAESRQLVQALQQALQANQQEVAQQEAQENQKAGEAYLAENGKREGVITTESGLQYEVLTAAEGDKPSATDTVEVHYHGTLIDGTVFDSSVDRGESISFPLNGVIKGWTEGVQLMSVGSKYRFHIPAELAYGGRATGKIGANSALIFDVELISIAASDAK